LELRYFSSETVPEEYYQPIQKYEPKENTVDSAWSSMEIIRSSERLSVE